MRMTLKLLRLMKMQLPSLHKWFLYGYYVMSHEVSRTPNERGTHGRR